MPGLSFLSKKSWHTSNIDNVERVWLAEQKAEAEKKKLDELQKQLNEERQIQELRQLQVESGQKVKQVDTSLDWMYQGPSADLQKQQTSEEYLLGKIFKPKQEANIDFNKKDSSSDTAWMSKVASKNDSFTRVHEDPILLIKQEEKRKRELIINNPLKMDKIRQKISQELQKTEEEKRLKKQAKKDKKERKKESKKDKKRARSVSKSDDENDSVSDRSRSPPRRSNDKHRKASESPDRSRVRSRSRERYDTHKRSDSRERGRRDDSRDNRNRRDNDRSSYTRDDDRRRDDSRSRYNNNNNSSNNHYNSSKDRRRDSRSPNSRRHSRDDSNDRNYSSNNNNSSKRTRHDSFDQPAAPVNNSSSSSSSHHVPSDNSRNPTTSHRNDDSDSRSNSEDSRKQRGGIVKYGLISKNNRASNRSDDNSLGPSAALLQKKADKDRLEQEQRHRHRTDISALTAEEREKRIAQMQQDADVNDSTRTTRMDAFAKNEQKDVDNSGNATFLSSMRKTVYTSSVDMKDRLNQNKHYVQSSSHMESDNGFRKK